MIIGLFIRHYKCYHKLNFIPFVTPYKQPKLNLIIGNNGSGKSSILESLDFYFNKNQTNKFILSKDEKRIDAFVSPVFLFNKDVVDKIWANHIGSIKKQEIEEIALAISDFLWSFKGAKSSKPQVEFEKTIQSLGEKVTQKTHFLLVDGVNSDGELTLATLDQLRTNLDDKFSHAVVKLFFLSLRTVMKFVYIPVETSIQDYLRLESQGIEALMGTDVKSKIESIFQDTITKDGKDYSLIGYLNDTLNEFVKSTEDTIQTIEKDYSFSPDYGVKKNVTPKDLRERVVVEFFKNRQLKKGKTRIDDLSSGQRKKALVDIIYSLILSNKSESDRVIILAIDEPEASLHVNNCYEQFEKLQKISNHEVQTLITTHWFGAIPILENGTINHVFEVTDEPPSINTFDAANVYDNHDAHRIEDINFKSIYDLSSSLLSMLRYGDKDWIIVEGLSDKYYLECYFNHSKVKILSIGGIDRLIDVVNFLSIPLGKRDEKKASKNKIIFLSDNDREYKKSDSKASEKLLFKRYTFVDGSVKLIDYSEPRHGEILRIEDVMDSETMWNSLRKLSDEIPDLKTILDEFELESDFSISMFKGDYSFLKTKKTGLEKVNLFKKLEKVLTPLKTRLALIYKDLSFIEDVIWVGDLKILLEK
jgi:ABC-type cobalamin/Fe3+-siderophores transport system ATPase subunit